MTEQTVSIGLSVSESEMYELISDRYGIEFYKSGRRVECPVEHLSDIIAASVLIMDELTELNDTEGCEKTTRDAHSLITKFAHNIPDDYDHDKIRDSVFENELLRERMSEESIQEVREDLYG